MRKLFLIAVLLLLAINGVIAQNPNNHWQLGVTDVNFTTNPPTISTVSNSGQYGNATISDSNGNLLFYTNGMKVWNKNHAVMTNGNFSQYINSVMIVPNPANANQYYIFKSLAMSTLGSSAWSVYNYSIVEFNAANPLGIVLTINSMPDYNGEDNYSIKLRAADGSDFENKWNFGPLTVAKNAAGDGYWIIVQNQVKISSYRLDNSGFNPVPVESTFTNAQIYNPTQNYANPGYGGFDLRGRIQQRFKMLPDNTKIGALITCSQNTSSNTSDFYTLNFNSSTGQASNFTAVHGETTYIGNARILSDFEFSNNSDNVYFIRSPYQWNNTSVPTGEIVVKSLSNLANPVRSLNQFGNATIFPAKFSYLQRDKHGNVLISSTYTDASRNMYIHKIDDQNSYSNSSIVVNSIALTSPVSGLPQIIPIISAACPNNLVVTQNVTTGQDNRQAALSIEATNAISGNTTSAIYHAGNTVVFKPSFNITSGAKLHAYIAGCTGTFLSKTSYDYIDGPEEMTMQESAKEINKKMAVKVSPNPNNGIFKVLTDTAHGNIQITDIYGLNVFKSDFKNQNEIEVNIQNQPKGIYIIKVISANQIYTDKIFKN